MSMSIYHLKPYCFKWQTCYQWIIRLEKNITQLLSTIQTLKHIIYIIWTSQDHKIYPFTSNRYHTIIPPLPMVINMLPYYTMILESVIFMNQPLNYNRRFIQTEIWKSGGYETKMIQVTPVSTYCSQNHLKYHKQFNFNHVDGSIWINQQSLKHLLSDR